MRRGPSSVRPWIGFLHRQIHSRRIQRIRHRHLDRGRSRRIIGRIGVRKVTATGGALQPACFWVSAGASGPVPPCTHFLKREHGIPVFSYKTSQMREYFTVIRELMQSGPHGTTLSLVAFPWEGEVVAESLALLRSWCLKSRSITRRISHV